MRTASATSSCIAGRTAASAFVKDFCDLTAATTPAATVLAVRVRGDVLDYLVLADSTLLLDCRDGLREITGGPCWVNADPAGAEAAITGTVPLRDVRHAFLLTDGATRLVDMFGAADWGGLARLAVESGPAALAERTREIERTDPQAVRWPRSKPNDDATAAVCTFSRG